MAFDGVAFDLLAFDADLTAPAIVIGGVLPRVRVMGISIRDQLNNVTNTCSFMVDGTTPTVGQEVQVGLGDLSVPNLLFAGAIDSVEQIFEGGKAVYRAWRVSCQDYTNSLNRRKMRKRYAQQSATAIALDVIATYTTGFTTAGVVAGLPTVTGGIDYTEEDVGAALSRLAQRIGGYWYVDYGKDIHLFLTEVTAAPDALALGTAFLIDPPIPTQIDLSQIRTRVWVEGGGSTARIAIAIGSVTLQVTDASWYPPGGGIVVSGPQRITYTGKGDVGGPSAPSGTASLVVGNLGSGPYTYKVSHINAGVETPLSAASGAISIAAVPDPTTAVTAANGSYVPPSSAPTVGAPTAGAGPDNGSHEYAVTFTTATGETTPGPRASVTTGLTTAPSATPAGVETGAAGNLTPGAYKYKVTYVTGAGETTPTSASADVFVSNLPSISSSGLSLAGTTGGSLTPSSFYSYFITATDAAGETVQIGNTGITIGASDTAVQISNVPTCADARCTGRRVYAIGPGDVGYHLVGTIGNNSGGVTFTDTMADATRHSQPAPPSSNTSGSGQITVSNIQVSGDSHVTARRIYRTTVGGATYALAGTVNNNTGTTFADNVADASLGAAAPASNTSLYAVVPLSAIPTGPSGTTGRKVYRTTAAAPSGTLKLVTTLANNSTTTYTDTTADASLGAAAPTTNTAGGSLGTGVYGWRVTYVTSQGETAGNTPATASITTGSGALTNIPTSSDARVTARKVYRTTVGGSAYLYEATIGDNTTTTFTSAGADGALGSAYSGVNSTAGGGKIALTGIATGGGGVTARKLYRTATGGATYKLVTTINDNSTTTYTDNVADSSLGVVAPGDTITELTGIPASGPGSILYEIRAGDDVNVLVQCDDAAAQTALAALEGSGDGIVEHYIQDRRLSEGEARATGNADLALFSRPITTIRYATRDPKTRSGKTVHVDLPMLDLVGDFVIQSVTIDQIGVAPNLYPRYTVEASSVRFSFEDVLRRLRLA